MLKNKFILTLLMGMMLLSFATAGDLSLSPAKQVTDKDVLDSSYLVTEKDVYFKDLKQTKPIVWIDKKVEDVYHVDSLKNFVENESVTLEFYYDIQPDYIAHYAHSGKFDRYYFPTQWSWTPDCVLDVCSGGWVQVEIFNIEEGTGSSTFPIGTTGPTWIYDGQFAGEFDGISGYFETTQTSLNYTKNWTIGLWINPKSTATGEIFEGQDDTASGYRIQYDSGAGGRVEMFLGNGTDNRVNYPIPLNNWVYLLSNYRDNGNFTFYVDGLLVLEDSIPNFVDTITSDIFGSFRLKNAEFFNGSIDEVLIYNRSLTQAEITSLYNNYTLLSTGPQRTGTPSTDGLVLDINFDDYSIQDNSGSGNHGTNTNVSFGEVLSNDQTLTGSDYGITNGKFIISNDLYSWNKLNIIYSYIYHKPTVQGLTGNFTAGIDNVSEKIPTILLISAVILLFGVLIILIAKSKEMGIGDGASL